MENPIKKPIKMPIDKPTKTNVGKVMLTPVRLGLLVGNLYMLCIHAEHGKKIVPLTLTQKNQGPRSPLGHIEEIHEVLLFSPWVGIPGI